MPRPRPAASLDAIVVILEAHPDGLSIEDLNAQVPTLSRRTLQRYLAQLASADPRSCGHAPRLWSRPATSTLSSQWR